MTSTRAPRSAAAGGQLADRPRAEHDDRLAGATAARTTARTAMEKGSTSAAMAASVLAEGEDLVGGDGQALLQRTVDVDADSSKASQTLRARAARVAGAA